MRAQYQFAESYSKEYEGTSTNILIPQKKMYQNGTGGKTCRPRKCTVHRQGFVEILKEFETCGKAPSARLTLRTYTKLEL